MIWWMIAAVGAYFIKGLCGFANTLVFTTILSFGNDNRNISPVELILGYLTNIIMARKERKAIKWRRCAPMIVCVMAGGKVLDERVVKWMVIIMLILSGIALII